MKVLTCVTTATLCTETCLAPSLSPRTPEGLCASFLGSSVSGQQCSKFSFHIAYVSHISAKLSHPRHVPHSCIHQSTQKPSPHLIHSFIFRGLTYTKCTTLRAQLNQAVFVRSRYNSEHIARVGMCPPKCTCWKTQCPVQMD